MGMLHSLFVKLAMLLVSIGLVCWIGWQRAGEDSLPIASGDEPQAVAVTLPASVEPYASRSERLTARPVTAKAGAVQKGNGESAGHSLLELNRADAKDFESLPGIGPVLAQRVIDYRTTVGKFETIDDLRAVKGIGPKIFERIKPLVTVANVATVDVKRKAEKRL